MYISEIIIKNYRSFGNVPFKMELKKFTTIIGANNVGKTNLLESIGLILSQDITMFKKRMLQIEDINYTTRLNFKKDVLNDSISYEKIEFPKVTVQLTFEEMNNKQLSVVGDWLSTKTMDKAKLTYEFKPSNNFDKETWIKEQREKIKQLLSEKEDIKEDELIHFIEFPIKSYQYVIYGGNDRTNRVDPYFLSMLKLEFLNALRDAKRELIANGDYKLLYRILNQGNENAYEDIKEVLNTLDEKIKNNKQLKELKKTLMSQLNRISLQGSEENKIDFNFSTLETSEILKKLSLIYGQDPITIERNGLGRNNLLYISLILSHLAPEENIDVCFRVVGIEEPEAHLHPHLQKHLANNIEGINASRDDLQIILTSHSTHITSSLNTDNMVILYKNGADIKKHYITDGFKDDKKGREHRHYLEKYLDATNSSMFYARRIILVEGIAEQILVPVLFNLTYSRTLDSIGCNVINVNGVAFKHFLEIIKNGYFIKCAVLTDGDEGKRTENRAVNLKRDYEKPYKNIKVSINKDTFEKELIEANRDGKGKKVLLKALNSTRPKLGPEYSEKVSNKGIGSEEFFSMIEEYKSEFAFNLGDELKKIGKSDFKVPTYIKEVFEFIMDIDR
jgi:putative ATP-dependent endonuclease of the OLD family